MWCTLRNLALFATLVASSILPRPASAQALKDQDRSTRFDTPLLTTDKTLLASLNRISRGSALWRAAIESVRKTGRRVLVVTPGEVTFTSGNLPQNRDGYDPGVLAEAVPIVTQESEIPLVVIVVNLRLVQETHDARLSVPREFEADLDRILVHEIYGHAVPYLLAGNLSGRCPDPKPEESASDACSIRRENAVRAELGLGRRNDHGLASLTLATGARQANGLSR